MLKFKYALIFSLLILAACKEEAPSEPEPEKKVECILDGSFVLVSDSTVESLRASDSLLIEELSFFKNYCTFTYDSIGYRGTYGCLEPYVWVAVEGFDTLRLEILSEDEYFGQGFIEGRYLRKGSVLLEEILKAQENTGLENVEPTEKVEKTERNTPTTQKVEKNPNDKVVTNQPTTTPANTAGLKTAKVSYGDNLSGNTYRVRLYEPYAGGIKSNEDAKIYLMLTVDAQGNVVKVENNASKTSTKNTQLLNDIIALAKKIKYNKESGANMAKVPLTISVNVD